MSAQEQQQKRKRKQPPTFQHLHPSQAKKLKKAWIEKAQIKSKWSKEKRKLQEEGIIPNSKIPQGIHNEEEETRESDDDHPQQHRSEDEQELDPEENQRPVKRLKKSGAQKTGVPPHLRKNDLSSPHPLPRQTRPERSKPKSSWKDQMQDGPSSENDPKGKSKARHPHDHDDEGDEEHEKSLRDLKREAYDKKLLHNFRADPLHKHSGRGRFDASRGGGGRGRGRGGREQRGQPNMKLRMNYMLEKIKRDYAVPSA